MAKASAVPAPDRRPDEVNTLLFSGPHAAVIIAVIVAAVVLTVLGLPVGDILLLLGGAGAIGAGIVVSVVVPNRRANRRLARLVQAYLTSSAEN
ncbi:hypothetical protein [Streptomyces europaeiscabiei]|uniref:hypothetical protein n=1 Tax=Streptomyces europaeiscabiei TaxID=146819 RepID=UPI000E67982F|nr:hypothetical protein [Streptomyces europaeiscabiei]